MLNIEFLNNWLGIREIKALISYSLCPQSNYSEGGKKIAILLAKLKYIA